MGKCVEHCERNPNLEIGQHSSDPCFQASRLQLFMPLFP